MTTEYKFYKIHQKSFDDIIKSFEKGFEKNSFDKNIIECNLILNENNDNIIHTQRILKVRLPTKMPEMVTKHVIDNFIMIKHTTMLNVDKREYTINATNITYGPKIHFNENAKFVELDNQTTIFDLSASINVNIIYGMNKLVAKMIKESYKNYYEGEEHEKRVNL